MKRFSSVFRLMAAGGCSFVFICFPFYLHAQLRFGHSIQQIANAGILYAGMENRILVTGIAKNSSPAFISSAGSVLQPVAGGCIIVPQVKEGMDTIRVMQSGTETGYHVFRILPDADLLPQLAFTPDTSMALARILGNPYLGVWHPAGKPASGMQVVSFNCTVRNIRGDVFYFTATGNQLTPEMLMAIKALRRESVLEFDQIRVSAGRDQPAKFLTPLKVVVK